MEDRARHKERQKEEEKRKEAAEAEAKKKAAKATGMGKKSRSETSMMSMAKKAIPARYHTNLFLSFYLQVNIWTKSSSVALKLKDIFFVH